MNNLCLTNYGLQRYIADFKTRKDKLKVEPKQIAIRKIIVGKFGGVTIMYDITAT